MSQVVCVKVKDIRPKYDNLKEWMADPNNLYIGRSAIVFIDGERYPKESSAWSNPYKIDKDGTRDEVLTKYETYIRKKINMGQLDIAELKDKTLGCWCKPDRCHGDILVKLIVDYYREIPLISDGDPDFKLVRTKVRTDFEPLGSKSV